MAKIAIFDLHETESDFQHVTDEELKSIQGGWIAIAIRVAIALAALLYSSEAN
jgi:lactobin A/cerein 7B family class IIb bacteriocin